MGWPVRAPGPRRRCGRRHDEAFLAEPGSDKLGDAPVVLDHEDAHAPIVVCEDDGRQGARPVALAAIGSALCLLAPVVIVATGFGAVDGEPHDPRPLPDAPADGPRDGVPVIVSSGDGGWIHLGPHVAEVLAAKGYFVVGFDVKAYLASFTSGAATVRPQDEPGDYRALVDVRSARAAQRPILVGVSEGAGLSVMAATDPATRSRHRRRRRALACPTSTSSDGDGSDALIYLTHGVPHEPTFSAASLATAWRRLRWRPFTRRRTSLSP